MATPTVARPLRFLHTSDSHLGHQRYTATTAAGINQREQDLYDAFDAVIDAAVADPPDAFIHAGDLFDGVRPSNRALAVALEGFLRLSRAGIPTIVIAGNHEHPKLRETGSPMRLFAHLPHVHPVYKGKAESFTLGDLHVHAVPQCKDNQTLAEQVAAIDRSAAGRHVLVLHGAVHSLQAFSHAEFNELTLQLRWFEGFDYVALGHYHGTQEIAKNAWYCGAPERVSMAEAGETKGYLDVRLDPLQVTRVPLAGRPFLRLPDIDCTGLDAEGVKDACTKATEQVPPEAVVRLRLKDIGADLRTVLDLRSWRPRCLHFQLEPSFVDTDQATRGGERLGDLASEFESFAAARPIERLDRERLLALARGLLQ